MGCCPHTRRFPVRGQGKSGNRAEVGYHPILNIQPIAYVNLHNRSANQSDASFGLTAAIAEALLQSHAGEIALLPALPPHWPNGSVRGLRARGAFELDITWRDGKLVEAAIRSLNGGSTKLRYGSVTREVKLRKGEVYRWNGQ